MLISKVVKKRSLFPAIFNTIQKFAMITMITMIPTLV